MVDLESFELPKVDLPALPPLPSPADFGVDPAAVTALQATAQPVLDYLSTVPHLFSVATFLPQLFWLLIILPKLDR